MKCVVSVNEILFICKQKHGGHGHTTCLALHTFLTPTVQSGTEINKYKYIYLKKDTCQVLQCRNPPLWRYLPWYTLRKVSFALWPLLTKRGKLFTRLTCISQVWFYCSGVERLRVSKSGTSLIMETQEKGWGIQIDRKKGLKKDIQGNELSKSTNELITDR